MASRSHHPVLPRLDAIEPDRPPPALVSELLEEIFIRLSSPADLARASAACVSFRRLISNPSFLRRYRSIHPPLLLGFVVHQAGLQPVEGTHPSAAIGRAVAQTADFSFDFLPTPGSWYPSDGRDGRVFVRSWFPCDVRDGCVLVQSRGVHIKKLDMGTGYHFVWDLAVCDPLTRRYLLLPPMIDDLLASVDLSNQDLPNSWASLIPSGGMEKETSSSVICWVTSKTRLVVFIFSTSSSHWTVGTSISWADLGLYGEVGRLELDPGQYVYGYFYWKVSYRNKLLKLDMSTMELSTYDLPPHYDERRVAIVESGEGKVAMFSLLDEGTSLEYYTLLQNGTEKSHKWHLKSTIPLPVHGTRAFIITGQAEGYVFIVCMQYKTSSEFFSLEVKSCNIERVCRTIATLVAHPYLGFPPSMSPRRIQGYGED